MPGYDFVPTAENSFNYDFESCTLEQAQGVLWLSSVVSLRVDGYSSTEEWLFDAATGAPLPLPEVLFQALFTPGGYLDFIGKYWIKAVKKSFKEARACAGEAPYRESSLYYEIGYRVDGGELWVRFVGEAYPPNNRACNPDVEKSIPLAQVKPYLNALGRRVLVESNFPGMSPIEQYVANKQFAPLRQDNVYIFGKINGKWPFSLAVRVTKDGIVTGYYYYDSKRVKIDLSGTWRNGVLRLTEQVNGKKTGAFEFMLASDGTSRGVFFSGLDDMLAGEWTSGDGKKSYPVELTALKASQNKVLDRFKK